MNSAVDFLAAIVAELGQGPDHCGSGQLVRFSTAAKRSDRSGWARMFEDGCGGVFGDWRTGATGVWQLERRSMSVSDRELQRRHIEDARAQRTAEKSRRQFEVAARAQHIWRSAPAVARHPYAARKGFVPGPGLRVTRGHLADIAGQFYAPGNSGRSERLKGDLLLIPMYGKDRHLWSLQAIDAAGRKSFLKGGRTRGLFCVVGGRILADSNCDTFTGDIAVAEGIATASSVHELSGSVVFAAFNAGNLLHVALAVRQLFPKARITVAGDVDRSGVGQAKAEEAAAAVMGFVSLPPLGSDETANGATDWNDYVQLHRHATRTAQA